MTLNKSSYECYSKDSIKNIINKKYKPPKKKNSQFSLDEWSEEHPTMFSVILIIVVLIVAVAIFIPWGMASWEEGKKSAYPQATIDQSYKSTSNTNVDANLPSKKQVISKSKELLFTAVSNKISYSDRTEIDNSFFVNSCIVDASSAVVHATFKLKGVENAYSVEFKMMNGEITPTQIYYDNGITPAFYWKK